MRDAGLFALSLLSAAEGGALVGFDFPIGLPLRYARRAGISRFLEVLPRFGEGEWAHFYDVAARADEISLHRPFYPASPGGKLRADLTTALGISDLRRQCDYRTAERRAAAELFWTIGAQQVGKAAISGWKEILAPALKMPDYVPLAIWPFSGAFDSLLKPGWIVACEAYPGEYYAHLGVRFPRKPGGRSGKRVQADRAANALALIDFAVNRGIALDPALVEALKDGCGADAYGEDRFDSARRAVRDAQRRAGASPSWRPARAGNRADRGLDSGDDEPRFLARSTTSITPVAFGRKSAYCLGTI